MSKGSRNRTKDKKRYDENFDYYQKCKKKPEKEYEYVRVIGLKNFKEVTHT